jgi:PAS domain S-box-containing protein
MTGSLLFLEAAKNVGIVTGIVVVYTLARASAMGWPASVQRAVMGIVLGLGAATAMLLPVDLVPGIRVDARGVPLILAAPFGGFGAAAIAALVAAAFRIWLGGAGVPAGLAYIVFSAGSGAVFYIWLKRSGRDLKHRHLIALGFIAAASGHAALLALPERTASALIVQLVPAQALTVITVLLLGSLLLLERRRSELEDTVRASAAQYRMLADNATDVISRFGPDLRHRYISPGCERLFGYKPDELLGQPILDLFHPEDRQVIPEALKRIQVGGEGAPVRYRLRRRDGEYIWIETSLAKVADDCSGQIEVIAVARNIEASKRLEQELASAKDKAEAANRAKSEFLAGMSHELRTPLNAIIGFAELIAAEAAEAGGNERHADYAQDIGNAGQHLLEMINDVLDLAKIEAGRLALEDQAFDPVSAVHGCARLLARRAENAGVSLTVRPGVWDGLVVADERRFRQIVLNLLSNAVKYTVAGGRVELTMGKDPQGGLMVTVADTGIGIAENDLKKVMEPFGQVKNHLSRGVEGTGLGLPLTKRLVEMHGGLLDLRSRLGEGTSVVVWFPASRTLNRAA